MREEGMPAPAGNRRNIYMYGPVTRLSVRGGEEQHLPSNAKVTLRSMWEESCTQSSTEGAPIVVAPN